MQHTRKDEQQDKNKRRKFDFHGFNFHAPEGTLSSNALLAQCRSSTHTAAPVKLGSNDSMEGEDCAGQIELHR